MRDGEQGWKRGGAAVLGVFLLVAASSFATPVAAMPDSITIHDSAQGAEISVAGDGETVYVRATAGTASGGTVTADVDNQNGGTITITLYDDGSVSDPDPDVPGEGDYWGSFTLTSGSTSGTTLSVDEGTGATVTADVDAGTDPGTATVTADYTAPTVTAATTLDRDGDGKIDAASLTFSEAVDDATVTPSDYRVGGQAGESVDTLSSADDDTLQIQLITDANEVPGTDAKDVTYTAGTTADAAGNPLASVAPGAVTETDGAQPVVTDGQYADADADGTVDEVSVTFSEAVSYSAFDADDWTVTANGLWGLGLGGLAGGSGTNTLRFDASATAGSTGVDGGTEPAVGYDAAGTGTVEDQAATPNELVDGSGVTLADAANPTVTGLEIGDTTGDGDIDEVVIAFTEFVDTDDGAAPVAADVGTLTLPDGSTADLSGATVTDPAGAAGTVTVSSVAGQSTANTAVGSTDISGDVSANWVDASAAANALVATLDDESVTDSAAPVETTATYRDTSGDGAVDRIDVDYTEDVAASGAEAGDYALGGTDAGRVTLDSAAVSGTTLQLGVTTSLANPSLTLDYDATAGAADSVTDGTNPAGGFVGASVADGVVPTLSAAETLDRDGDGSVDAATLTFSEAVADASVTPSDYRIDGQAAEAVDTLSSADDDTVQVGITTDADEVSGTDAKDVTYAAGTTTDAAGNALGSVAAGDVNEVDGAAPVVSAFSLTEDMENEELDVSFDASETLVAVSVAITGPERATLTSFSMSEGTSSASAAVATDGDYTATLDTAADAAGNGAATVSDTATVSYVPEGSSSLVLSGSGSRVRIAGTTGLAEVGVRFSGTGAGSVSATEVPSLSDDIPPGTFVSAVDITVPGSFTDTESTVSFVVWRDRLDDLGVDATDLRVYHRHDGSWDALETRVVDRGDHVVVEAVTPGFSRFVVMAGGSTSGGTVTTATAASGSSAGADDSDSSADDSSDTSQSQSQSQGQGQSQSTGDDGTAASGGADGDAGTTASGTPGFGVGVAVVALVAFLAVGLRRRG